MRRYRSLSAALFAVLLSAVLGGFFGKSALAREDNVSVRYNAFRTALLDIQAEYVDKVEPDRLVYSAISGMLQTLDPHSSFLDPRTFAQLRERQEGRYYGLGITISSADGDINVVSLFEGSPAYKQGIRRGDVIATILGEDAKGWTTDQAVSKLRGPKGTSVNIGIRRKGYDRVIDMSVERDEIKIPSIQGYFMVDASTAYVRLRDFSETTDRDLKAALTQLTHDGMKRLVLDLRDNPGGPLDQAIKVSNTFLPQGDLIVYTRGRSRGSDQDYRATEETAYTHLPLIVLVNRNSASASEIVAGALQDHDRALVVGETTFGKALVQSQYRISLGAGLALTTAHYFTPSGRMIQRPWDSTFDEYLTYTYRDQAEGPHLAADLKYTDAGRKVFGGGGIEPDKRLPGPVEGFNPSRFARGLYARQLFASYAQRFSAEGDPRVPAGAKDRKWVKRDYVVDDAMVEDFKQHARAEKVAIDETAFAKDKEFIRAMIRYDLDVALFGAEYARHRLFVDDPQGQFAMSLFGEAEKLTQLTKMKPTAVVER